jgi:hypothetical protein
MYKWRGVKFKLFKIKCMFSFVSFEMRINLEVNEVECVNFNGLINICGFAGYFKSLC